MITKILANAFARQTHVALGYTEEAHVTSENNPKQTIKIYRHSDGSLLLDLGNSKIQLKIDNSGIPTVINPPAPEISKE